MASSILRADVQKTLTAAQIVAASPDYTPVLVGGVRAPFNSPMRIVMFQNLTDALLQFSFDGLVDHFPLPPNGFYLLDIMTNQDQTDDGWFVEKGTLIFVKEIDVPTTGSIYVSSCFAKGT
jgi:hypothetical protein